MSPSISVALEPASQYYIRQVKRKLAAGAYHTEPAACFCGSTDAMLVTDKDRYGFAHAMWLCKECGVIYANPRMTDASYAEFYAIEYRHIYDEEGDGLAEQEQLGYERATALRDYLLTQHELRPSVVFDVGCNAGSWLQPFVEAGAAVHGVDYGPERVALGQSHGLPIEVGSIEALEVLGLQADLIIMNHVLEHATNLEATLLRIRGLLKDEGLLYVALPGLFLADLDALFQNAHPWQFTAETLAYVMECCGFQEVRADQGITSLWRKSDLFRDKADKPTRYVRDIANRLFKRGTRFVPTVRTFNKFPRLQRAEAVAQTVARQIPEIVELLQRHDGRQAIVLGGGPSVDGQIDTIKRLQSLGAVLICIERMAAWCRLHDIAPDYIVVHDASDDVAESFETLTPYATYLVASQCQAAVWDALAVASKYFFHTPQTDLSQEALGGPTEQGVIINAGGSVVLSSFSIAMLLGCQALHVFGFDCHTTAGGYAAGITGVGEQREHLPVKIGGKSFVTTLAYISFAQQFFELKALGERDGLLTSVKVYGDSLVTAMLEELRGDV